MQPLEFWISNGQLVPPKEAGTSLPERLIPDGDNIVKIVADDSGTAVRWHGFGANWASLFFAKEWIARFPGPYTLHYYFSGWFTETIADPVEARARIDTLIAKSDLNLSSRVYIQSFDPETRKLPELIRRTLDAGEAPAEASIDCSLDFDTGRVKVERIGAQSAIAQLWGLSPVSTPCLSGTTYDKAVSAAYAEVLHTGRPHYDHIYAAMAGRDGEIAWIPYQRVVMPHAKRRGRARLVSVVSEVTPVEIAVV
jgi:hypothetical protein